MVIVLIVFPTQRVFYIFC